MASKIREAQEHIRAADKHLKTNFLRWKPDYDGAADERLLAAQCYRVARNLAEAKEQYLEAAELFKKVNKFFPAAKAIEQAMLICKETSADGEVFKMAMEAASLFQQHGSGDSGVGVLDKAGGILVDRAPDLASKLFRQAADVSATQSSQHQAAEYLSKATRLLVRLDRHDEALDCIRQEVEYQKEGGNQGLVGRLCVVAVLIQLARGDSVAADKIFQEWGANCEAPEQETLSGLIAAYDEGDPESAKRHLGSSFIRSMDVEYARLANRLALPKPMQVPARAERAPVAAQNNPPPVEEAGSSRSSRRPSTSQQEEVYADPEEVVEGAAYATVTYEKKDSDDEEELC